MRESARSNDTTYAAGKLIEKKKIFLYREDPVFVPLVLPWLSFKKNFKNFLSLKFEPAGIFEKNRIFLFFPPISCGLCTGTKVPVILMVKDKILILQIF